MPSSASVAGSGIGAPTCDTVTAPALKFEMVIDPLGLTKNCNKKPSAFVVSNGVIPFEPKSDNEKTVPTGSFSSRLVKASDRK